ncbi:hypothetical protein ACTHOQ_15195 [Solibacillus silvestris]|uniref:hypothetical protein n=1 Tax=Solibacillus silvestris TaxID=76853 RepID=UPI003F7CFDCB
MDLDTIIQEYERTEITALWIHDRIQNRHYNILSIVEACPIEQQYSLPIESLDKNGEKVPFVGISLDQERTLYLRREFKETAEEGLAYFRGPRMMENVAIVSFDHLILDPPAEVPVLTKETKYPSTALEHILPRRSVAFRVCALFEEKQATLHQLTEQDFAKVAFLTKQYLGYDLSIYKEFIGAVLLALPNPYLRLVNILGAPEHTAIIAAFYERMGKSMIGGEIEICDIHIYGQGFHLRKRITNQRMLISLPYMPTRFKVRLFDAKSQLVYENEIAFMQAFHLNMQMANTVRKFKRLTGKESYKDFRRKLRKPKLESKGV